MLRLKSTISKFIAIVFISFSLAACGGGTSISGDTAPPVNNPPPANNPPPGGNNPPPAPVTRNINLSWTAPATRTDGSSVSLSDIGGYKLYVGSESGSYNPAIDVGNTTTHTLTSMSAGTYYLALSAYDTNALESAKSSEFTVVVN